MTTLKKAKKEFTTASPEVQAALIKLFGDKVKPKEKSKPASGKTVIERVTSLKASCDELGFQFRFLVAFLNVITKACPKPLKEFIVPICAVIKLMIIAHALRDGVVLDFDNNDQKKWEVVWKKDGNNGFRFSFARVDFDFSALGSRLSLDTEEKALHFGTVPEFVEIWNEFLK